jgi:hypothetical protein
MSSVAAAQDQDRHIASETSRRWVMNARAALLVTGIILSALTAALLTPTIRPRRSNRRHRSRCSVVTDESTRRTTRLPAKHGTSVARSTHRTIPVQRSISGWDPLPAEVGCPSVSTGRRTTSIDRKPPVDDPLSNAVANGVSQGVCTWEPAGAVGLRTGIPLHRFALLSPLKGVLSRGCATRVSGAPLWLVCWQSRREHR